MGPEFVAAAPYLFAGGTAAAMYGQNRQEKQQRSILNRAMSKTEEDQGRATAAALAEAQTMGADQRGQAMEAEQQAAFERAMADASAGDAGGANLDPSARGAVSADYIKLQGERGGSEGERLTAVARELSKLRGVSATQQNETMRRGALAERLGSMWNNDRQRAQAASRDAESVDMPAIGQIGQLAQLAGGAGMMAGAAPAAAGTVGGASGGGLAGMDLWAESMMAPAAAKTASIWGPATGMSMFQQQQRRRGAR